jgi:mRNA interferase MazF
MSLIVRRCDLFWANLDPTIGVEIQKTRPVVVLSHNTINERSQLVIVVPLNCATDDKHCQTVAKPCAYPSR